MRTNNSKKQKTALILGAGLGGLAAAIKLKQTGFNIHIIERNSSVGGTWFQNTYPGCACDVQVALYQFSFAKSENWSRLYPQAGELLQYAKDLVNRFDLAAHLQLNTEALDATYNEKSDKWRVKCDDDKAYSADILVCALGQLNRCAFPEITGREEFAGEQIHSAAWRHDVNLAGKRVGVIGTGASAVQIVPELTKIAKEVTVFQRSPNWIRARNDREIPASELALKRTHPEQAGRLADMYRDMLYQESDYFLWQAFEWNQTGRDAITQDALAHLQAQVSGESLREKLTPNYPIGCKRILCSDDYYPALNLPHVSLETSAIQSINKQGIVTNQQHKLDAIVYATGFETTGWKWSVNVCGLQGTLRDAWRTTPQAFKGTMVNNFPNMFVLYGPNTNVGHSSITFMLECQVDYMVKVLDTFSQCTSVMPSKQAQDRENARLQNKLNKTVWADDGCHSWYKNKDGVITQNWSSHTRDFAKLLSTVDSHDFVIKQRTDIAS